MGDVTSHPLANQAEAFLFGRSLNTSPCQIYDHKTAFLLVKTVLHKNFNFHIWKKRTDIIDLTLYSPVCEISHSVFDHVQYSTVIRYW